MSYEDLNKQLEPFKLMVFDEGTEDVWATLVLWLNEDYKQNVFDTRQEDGFLGNGYDWNSLATVFLEEKPFLSRSVISDISFFVTLTFLAVDLRFL